MSIFNYREQPGYFERLKEALRSTKQDLSDKMDQIFGTADSPITEDQIEDLENILISADIGVQTTLELTERIRDKTRGQRILTSYLYIHQPCFCESFLTLIYWSHSRLHRPNLEGPSCEIL
ncbi:signal recognition particle receptor subunit alpha [Acidobacteria bacterium AH-259-G07]|nr:signal recognition particle receptor subunit alpha [Acidobacteria bacterium AH-259-G07]